MTYPGPGGEFDPATAEKIEILPHYLKLYVLCGIFAVLAALCLKGALGTAGPGANLLFVLAVGSTFAASGVWRRARSGLPVVTIGKDGIEDCRHGFIPWSQIGRWKHSQSILNPGFGWSLVEGAEPPRNATLFRIAAAFNWFGGLGQRTYRRKMILGGVGPIADVFRRFHPDAEG